MVQHSRYLISILILLSTIVSGCNGNRYREVEQVANRLHAGVYHPVNATLLYNAQTTYHKEFVHPNCVQSQIDSVYQSEKLLVEVLSDYYMNLSSDGWILSEYNSYAKTESFMFLRKGDNLEVSVYAYEDVKGSLLGEFQVPAESHDTLYVVRFFYSEPTIAHCKV